MKWFELKSITEEVDKIEGLFGISPLIWLWERFRYMNREDKFQIEGGITSKICVLDMSKYRRYLCEQSHGGNSGPNFHDRKLKIASWKGGIQSWLTFKVSRFPNAKNVDNLVKLEKWDLDTAPSTTTKNVYYNKKNHCNNIEVIAIVYAKCCNKIWGNKFVLQKNFVAINLKYFNENFDVIIYLLLQ